MGRILVHYNTDASSRNDACNCVYNDRTVYLTGMITGDATQAVFSYPNSIKPQSVNIVNQINIFNTGTADLQSYSINNEVLVVNLQQASVPGRACGVYVKLTY